MREMCEIEEKALARAMRLCSRSEKCRFQLRQYLQKLTFAARNGRCRYECKEYGESAETSCGKSTMGIRRLNSEKIEQLLKRLEDEGFVDDRRFAQAYAKDRIHLSKWGVLKVRNSLVHFGIDNKLIDEAISAACESGQKNNLHLLIEGKLRSLLKNGNLHTLKYEQKQKMYARLYRYAIGRGYGHSEVMTELGMLFAQYI